VRDNINGWTGFSDSYRTKAHDQILELKNRRLEPERCAVDLLAEAVPPLRNLSSGTDPHRLWRCPLQLLHGCVVGGGQHLKHDPKLTCGGWHHMPLGVVIDIAGLLINNQFAHQWRDKNTKKLTRLSGIDRRRGCRRTCGIGFGWVMAGVRVSSVLTLRHRVGKDPAAAQLTRHFNFKTEQDLDPSRNWVGGETHCTLLMWSLLADEECAR